MKKVFLVLIILVILIGALLLAKNMILKSVLEKGLHTVTGLDFKTEAINVDIFSGSARITGLQIFNPSSFSEQLLAEVPQIYVECDIMALLKKKMHLKQLTINIKQLNVVLNNEAKNNLSSLALLIPKPQAEPPPEVTIDNLELKIDKVTFVNHFLTAGSQMIILTNVINEKITHVTDPKSLGQQIVNKLLARGGFSNAFHVTEQAKDVSGQLRGAIEETTQGLKKDLNSILGQ